MPIKNDVIVDTQLMPSVPLHRSWLPVEVSHIETPTRFYIRYIYGTNWNLGNEATRMFFHRNIENNPRSDQYDFSSSS